MERSGEGVAVCRVRGVVGADAIRDITGHRRDRLSAGFFTGLPSTHTVRHHGDERHTVIPHPRQFRLGQACEMDLDALLQLAQQEVILVLSAYGPDMSQAINIDLVSAWLAARVE